jgi:hypothetical protein
LISIVVRGVMTVGELIYVGIVPLIGAALYIFALGDIKRLDVQS